LVRTSLSANQISVIGIFAGILSGILAGLGIWGPSLVLISLAVLLDFSDGEVSRFRGKQTKEGSYLDKVYHFSVHPCLFAGVAIGAHRLRPTETILFAGFTAVICVSLFPIVMEYAGELVVWKHYQRFLKRRLSQENRASSAEPEPSGAVKLRPENSTPSPLRKMVRALTAWWDFPYVFIVMSLGLLLQILSDSKTTPSGFFPPVVAFVYFYALTYPVILTLAVTKTLRTRAIENRFQNTLERLRD